ncbi:MAG: ABC transporter permease [Eubacterium sp.]|nr:ABC transporter permease [Eubacterium sp.]
MKDRRGYLGIFYVIFLVVFVVLPLLVVGYYAFTNSEGRFTVENFTEFFTNGKMLGTFVYSLAIAFCTTALALLIAYPTAYVLVRKNIKKSGVLVTLLVLPMWINFTLRITAMKEILSTIEGNLAYYPFFNTVLCQVYDFLPFMILPIYTCIEDIDWGYIEAARDLGARKRMAFVKVLLPLSMPGIASGITMVFLPAMTNYVVLDMIYNSTYIMGSLIGSYFAAFDWHRGSMVSIILLLFILLASYTKTRAQRAESEVA